MPLLDNLKQMFGLGADANVAPKTPEQVRPNVAPAPNLPDEPEKEQPTAAPTPAQTRPAATSVDASPVRPDTPAATPAPDRPAATSEPAQTTPTNVATGATTPNVAETLVAASRPAPSGLPPTPRLREQLIGFIVNHLTAYTNETEGLPNGLTLYICTDDPAEQDGLNVALYASQPGQFQRELSRHLADHYIQLAPGWQFQWQYTAGSLPATCAYKQGNFGLNVHHPALEKPLRARIQALVGQTANDHYVLDPTVQTEFRIGRGRVGETASGRVRTNDIAFLDGSEPEFDAERGDANLSVSRQHATIRYDAENRRYRLTADAGGLPASGNKTKILRTDDTVERVDLPGVGYMLHSGDQIELGGDAKLMFEIEP